MIFIASCQSFSPVSLLPRYPKTQIVTSGIIQNSDNKFLIVKRAANDSFPNTWEFPGGKNDFGESPEQGVIREIQEETGLTVVPTLPVTVNSYGSDRKPDIFYVEIFYLCQIQSSEEVILSQEHSDFAWIDFNEIHNYQTTEYIHKVIEKTAILLTF